MCSWLIWALCVHLDWLKILFSETTTFALTASIQVFYFLFSVLAIWKDFKVLSSFIQQWIWPPACWLAHFYLLKKSTKGLHYFGLDFGMLEFFKYSTSENVIQRTIVDFLAFLEHGSAEKIAVCAHTNHDPNKQEVGFFFVWSLFKNSKLKLKNQKPTRLKTFIWPIQWYHCYADPIWPDLSLNFEITLFLAVKLREALC